MAAPPPPPGDLEELRWEEAEGSAGGGGVKSASDGGASGVGGGNGNGGDEEESTAAALGISAYPRLDAPENIEPAREFTLEIGLSREQYPGVSGGRMDVPAREEEFDLIVHVFAEDFIMPDGARHTLHVQKSRFQEAKTSVRLVAPRVQEFSMYNLEVEYSYEGNPVGKGWRSIYVVPAGIAAPAEAVVTGSTPISPASPLTAPDLMVTIKISRDEHALWWAFDTAHPVDIPSSSIRTSLGRGNARTYALESIMSVSEADGTVLIDNKVLGIARRISRAIPSQFWDILAKVWEHMKRERSGDVPVLMLVSEDPYIPWELASTEERFIQASLTDANRPSLLGAQVKVGRWLPQGPSTPQGFLHPKLPPATQVSIEKMALVIGDYAATVAGVRPLPEAIEEGRQLEEKYPTIRIDGTLKDIDRLLGNQLVKDGKKVSVQAIHFACHGAVSNNSQYNGIVLSDTALRLGEDMIAGNRMTSETEPFVFLNACQLGQSSEVLGNYGGMAGAFLTEGCRGFIAPLWSVDDKVAREIGVEFYKRALTENVEVSEIMRDIRSKFDLNAESPPATYLAYMFYGHPKLVLNQAV